MKLIGFNYTKASIEKNKSSLADLKITSGINIESIEKVTTNSGKTDESIISVKWKYNISYTPKIADLIFEGNIILTMKEKEGEDILKGWKDKKLSEEFNLSILNVIIKKVSIKAAQFEDDFNLPTHFKLPTLKVQKSEKQ